MGGFAPDLLGGRGGERVYLLRGIFEKILIVIGEYVVLSILTVTCYCSFMGSKVSCGSNAYSA